MQTWAGCRARKRHGIARYKNRFQRARPRQRYLALGSFCRPGLLVILHQGAVACFAAVHSDIHPPTQAQA